MKITAKVENSFQQHEVSVQTNDQTQTLNIPGKASGLGSAVNGGVSEIQNTLRTGAKITLLS